jgi:hypothetical protein
MSAQNSYTLFQDKYLNGQLADLGFNEIVSFAAEGIVPFGVIVKRGTNKEDQASVGGPTNVLGVSIRDIAREYLVRGATTVSYADKTEVSVLRRGYFAVTLAAGGNPGDALFYTTATGVINVGTAGGGQTQLTAAQAELQTVTAAGAVGVVRISL